MCDVQSRVTAILLGLLDAGLLDEFHDLASYTRFGVPSAKKNKDEVDDLDEPTDSFGKLKQKMKDYGTMWLMIAI